MLTRRTLILSSAATLALAGMARFAPRAWAQSPQQATGFIRQTAEELVGVINKGGGGAQQRAQLQQIIDRVVDVDGVARFCLGRYWNTATPQQRSDYVALFHKVLLNNIAGKLGEYKGVTYSIGRATSGDGGVTVATTITRPGQAPADVSWVVGNAGGSPKIVDVIAEGTSLRITQRQDYASYIARNGNNVEALLDALRRQTSQT